jgi:hypothetical protein
MPDHDAAMLAFVKLAGVSQSRGQLGPRDKFLMLAGVAATRAGWSTVAARCRELVLAHNPSHLARRYATFADALRDTDFQPYLKQLERFCSYERAEHHLSQLEITPELPPISARITSGDYALLLLGRSVHRSPPPAP